MKKIKFGIVVFMLVGCMPAPGYTSEMVVTSEDYASVTRMTQNVYRFEDYEAGNVCYVLESADRGGISCVSLGDSK